VFRDGHTDRLAITLEHGPIEKFDSGAMTAVSQ
jgi:Cu/Ag efflux protein CusF